MSDWNRDENLRFRISRECEVAIQFRGKPTKEAIEFLQTMLLEMQDCYPSEIRVTAGAAENKNV